ncbi:unnamed protein product [Durusdinium trenchii]|uniref:Uncharacterized protein n=1 Tax=Durusdinium trenchii TaxID=1381693 RepID=A0ABP0KBW4_9DINO
MNLQRSGEDVQGMCTTQLVAEVPLQRLHMVFCLRGMLFAELEILAPAVYVSRPKANPRASTRSAHVWTRKRGQTKNPRSMCLRVVGMKTIGFESRAHMQAQLT